MKTNRSFLLAVTVLAGLLGWLVAQGQPAPKAQKPVTPPKEKPPARALTNTAVASELPVILYIEKRGQTIIVKSGPKGPLYTVKGADGKTRYENLSVEQLRAQAPELHQFIKTAVAQGAGKSGAVLDARISATR